MISLIPMWTGNEVSGCGLSHVEVVVTGKVCVHYKLLCSVSGCIK